jgi:outer membrane protein, multidrug efflux system
MKLKLPGRMAAGSLIAALISCSVGPAYRRPDIPAPAAWQDGYSATNVWPEAGWWHGFSSAQLDELIADAQRGNDDLAAAIARVREADAQAQIAGAHLLPTVDLGAMATRQRTQVNGLGPEVSTVLYPSLSASYELDFWGKNRALRRAATAAAQGSRFDQQTVALTVVTGVATSYFQALELRERIDVANETLASYRTILEGLKLEQSVGTATGLDVAQQETAVTTLNATIPALQLQLRQTIYSLAVLIGKNPDALELEPGSLAALTSLPVEAGMPSGLLMRRPDVAEAEQQLIAANADITVARAALFPDITLTATSGFESSTLAHLISPASRVYAGTAGLTQPIFHAGALHAQVAYSEARYEELLAMYHKTVLTAFSNAEGALVAAQQITEQQERQQAAVASAHRAYEFARMQMAAGTVNVLTVLNTENALFTAQDALLQVEFAHLQALVGLYAALGGGWQNEVESR